MCGDLVLANENRVVVVRVVLWVSGSCGDPSHGD